jgi:hypothetical protein
MIGAMAGDIMRTRYAAIAATAAILAAASLSGCGQDTNAPAVNPATPRIKPAAAAKKGPSVEELTAGMAAAPALGKSSLPLDVKFELSDRPKIGQMLEINLALIAQIAGGPATVQVSGADGFDAAQGDSQFDIPEVEAGTVYRHTLRVTPTTDGVLLVNLTVSLKHDEAIDSKLFSVPVIIDR